MSGFAIASIILSLTAFIGYINHRYIKMQPTIAIMACTMLFAVAIMITEKIGFATKLDAIIFDLLGHLNFQSLLINGMLSFLLFAGALNVDAHSLKKEKWEITILATFGTIASTLLVAVLVYYLLNMLGIHFEFIHALLFGALISPTDPIAVMATLRQIKAPPLLEAKVAGESLFNDGVAIVLFITLYEYAFSSSQNPSIWDVVQLFFQEAIGGVLFGIVLGMFAHHLMKQVTDHKVTALITLSIVTGGYSLAQSLHVSGPLAMVVAGMFIGNRGKDAITKPARERLHDFWELIDEILNAVLFLLIGLVLLQIDADRLAIIASILVIPVVLLVRFITVAGPMSLFKLTRKYSPYTISIMVWGGLRGGVAVALALAIPNLPEYPGLILAMTYSVVAFSVLVQGTTAKRLVERSKRAIENNK